jgi:hypothetical protein
MISEGPQADFKPLEFRCLVQSPAMRSNAGIANRQELTFWLGLALNKEIKGSKIIGNYTMLYSGASHNTRAQSGVALITDQKLTSRITNSHLSTTA